MTAMNHAHAVFRAQTCLLTRSSRGLAMLTAAAISLLGCAAPASTERAYAGQPKVVVSPLTVEGSLQTALDKANAEQRVLVVALAMGARQRDTASALWANPVLASWASRHAIIYGVSSQPDLAVLTALECTPTGGNVDPICFLSNLQLRMFGSTLPQRASRIVNPKGEPALGTALKLDWTLMKRAETEPAIAAARGRPGEAEFDRELRAVAEQLRSLVPPAHQQIASEPVAWLRAVHATRAASVASPAKPEKSADEATDASPSALSLYLAGFGTTELFAARMTVLAPELFALVNASPELRTKARQARAAMLAGPWLRDGTLMAEVLMISRITGDAPELLRFIDDSLNDADSVASMPKIERAKLDLLLRQVNWSVALPVAAEVKNALNRLTEPRPERFDESQWALLQATLRAASTLQAARALVLAADPFPAGPLPPPVASLIQADSALARATALALLAAGKGGPVTLALLGSGSSEGLKQLCADPAVADAPR